MRYGELVVLILALLLSCVGLSFQLTALFNQRAHDWAEVSSDVAFEQTSDSACIGIALPERIVQRYGKDARRNVVSIFATLSSSPVSCAESDDTRVELEHLVAASVHGLVYSAFMDGLAEVPDAAVLAVQTTAWTAVQAALGTAHATALNFSMALVALEHVSLSTPVLCDELYPEVPLALLATPRKNVTLQCDGASTGDATEPTVEERQRLHLHCVEQFRLNQYQPLTDDFGVLGMWRSGVGGTLGLPVYGNRTTPVWMPFLAPGFHDELDWMPRTKLLAGMHFGWAIFACLVWTALAAHLVFDTLLSIVVEVSLSDRLDNINDIGKPGATTQTILLLVLASQYKIRYYKFGIQVAVWFLGLALTAVFIWSPWNYGALFRRPVCVTDREAGGKGGGWADYSGVDAFEEVVVWLLLAAILVRPIGSLAARRIDQKRLGDMVPDVTTPVQSGQTATATWGFTAWVVLTVVGFLLFVIMQSIEAVVYGAAWATSISEPLEDDSWSTAQYAEKTFNSVSQAVGLAAIGVLVYSLVLARFQFTGQTFTSLFYMLLIMVAILIAFVLFLILTGFELNLSQHEFQCAVLDDKPDLQSLCNARWGVYLTAIILLFGSATLVFVLAVVRKLPACCQGGQKSSGMNGGALVRQKLAKGGATPGVQPPPKAAPVLPAADEVAECVRLLPPLPPSI